MNPLPLVVNATQKTAILFHNSPEFFWKSVLGLVICCVFVIMGKDLGKREEVNSRVPSWTYQSSTKCVAVKTPKSAERREFKCLAFLSERFRGGLK